MTTLLIPLITLCCCTYLWLFIYLLHFTLNTTPPPARVPSPNRAAAVAIASSGKQKIFVVWNKRQRKNSARQRLYGELTLREQGGQSRRTMPQSRQMMPLFKRTWVPTAVPTAHYQWFWFQSKRVSANDAIVSANDAIFKANPGLYCGLYCALSMVLV